MLGFVLLFNAANSFMVFGIPQGTYQHNGISCTYCQPGTHWAAHCTAEKQTTCMTCPENTYTAWENRARTCRRCSRSCTKYQLQVITGNCTIRSDTRCECKSGYYLRNRHDPRCIPHSYCPVGKGVVRGYGRPLIIGTPYSDTKCELCGNGFFSDKFSRTEPCKAHTKCEIIDIPGNSTHDTVCRKTPPYTVSDLYTPPTESAYTPAKLTAKKNDVYERKNVTVPGPPDGEPVWELGNVGIVILIVAVLILLTLVCFLVWWFMIRRRDRNLTSPVNLSADSRHKLDKVLENIRGSNSNLTKPVVSGNTGSNLGPAADKSGQVREHRMLIRRSTGSYSDLDSASDNDSQAPCNRRRLSYSRSNSKPGRDSTEMEPLVEESVPGASGNNGAYIHSNTEIHQPPVKIETNDELFWYVADKMDIKDSPWEKMIMMLPGDIRMDKPYIDRVVINTKQSTPFNCVQQCIYQCLAEWLEKNPEANVGEDIIKALQKTSTTGAHRPLIREIRKADISQLKDGCATMPETVL